MAIKIVGIILLTIVLIFVFFLILYASASEKKSILERYAEAFDKMLHDIADAVGGFFLYLAEPKAQRKIRLAQEELAKRNGALYRLSTGNERFLDGLLKVDKSFEQALEVLNLPEEDWKNKVAIKLFYIGFIEYASLLDSYELHNKTPEEARRNKVANWAENKIMENNYSTLRKALDYFHIPEEDWYKYGDAVIKMNNLYHDNYLKKYGYVDF